MRFVLVTGALGAGKTRVIHGIGRCFTENNAVLDGDALSMTRPGGTDRDRLDLVEANLVACAENFAAWGAEYLFAAWVIEDEERLRRLADTVCARGWTFQAIALTASHEKLLERLHARRDQPFEASDENVRWLTRLNGRIGKLPMCAQIDTTALSEARVIYEAAAAVREDRAVQAPAPPNRDVTNGRLRRTRGAFKMKLGLLRT